MITALKAINMTDKRLGLATYHNASLSSSEKLRNLVFLPFLGCKGISHLNYSCVAGSVGYNMLYRMMRLDSIDWRNVQARAYRPCLFAYRTQAHTRIQRPCSREERRQDLHPAGFFPARRKRQGGQSGSLLKGPQGKAFHRSWRGHARQREAQKVSADMGDDAQAAQCHGRKGCDV